jgi:phage terminase small subunit
MKNLTTRQQRFTEEYLVDCNATQAAIRAGYSPKGATVRGSELLANRNILGRISDLRKMQADRTGVNADRVVSELASIGFLKPDKFFKFDNGMAILDFSRLTEEDAKGIAEIQQEVYVEKDGTADGRIVKRTRIKFQNKLQALEALAKHTGIYNRDNENRRRELREVVKEAMREVERMTPEERSERLSVLRNQTKIE